MTTPTLAPDKVRERGFRALRRELGVVGMVRFIQQFRSGTGDYTKDRHAILDKFTLDDVISAIKKRRKKR